MHERGWGKSKRKVHQTHKCDIYSTGLLNNHEDQGVPFPFTFLLLNVDWLPLD